MAFAHKKSAVIAVAVVFVLSVTVRVAASIEVGQAQVTLNGVVAPPPSSSACGFALIAPQEGAQIAIMGWSEFVVAARRGEEACVEISISGLEAATTVTAEVVHLEGTAEVVLSLDDESANRRALAEGKVSLSVSSLGRHQRVVLRLRTRALSNETAVQWRRIRFSTAKRSWDVNQFGGIRWPPTRPTGNGAPPVLPPMRRPIEQALIEWDWRMQDGIGTDRNPSAYDEAIGRTLKRGDELISDLRAAGVDLDREWRQWEALRQEWTRSRKGEQGKSWFPGATESHAQESLWRRIHLVRRTMALKNPLADLGPVLFAKQVPGCFSHQLTQYYGSCAKPGGGVFVLDSPGKSMQCRQLAAGMLPLGSYQHPEVSFDGKRVLFAYCHAETAPPNRETCLDRFYHLYEMTADGSNLQQLTDGPFDDFAPRYLPNGKIIFVSTRRQGFHRCGRGPCPTYALAICNGDGSDPHPISYHETHEWDPAVLADGRIIYTRWDYVDRHAVYYEQLWTVRPDGTDARAYYGNNTFNPVGVWEARAIPGSRRVMATAAAHHAMTAGSIVLLDVNRGMDGLEPITRLTPDALFPESEEPLSNGQKGYWRALAGIAQPPPVPAEAARWPGHCYRTPYPLSEKYFLTAYSFDALIGEPNANPANMFGIYLADCFGNKELLYRDLNIASLWPAPLRARSRPPAMPSIAEPTDTREGTFFLQNVYASWLPLSGFTIKQLRILQVLPKSTPHINAPTVGLANASPGKQVLGTVPVEPDGSAYFRAPAGIPLSFQALDDRGQAVQIMRSLTYLQPGETASCLGCHEPRETAPSAQPGALALKRPPSSIKPGPDGSKPFSYPLLVQPVLDRLCVSCHSDEKPEGKIVLTGKPQGRYTVSYNALAPRVRYSAWGARGDFRQTNSEPATVPGFFGARGSTLIKLLLNDHYGVALSSADIERLVTWMDTNALFYGTFDPPDQARQQRGERIEGPKIE